MQPPTDNRLFDHLQVDHRKMPPAFVALAAHPSGGLPTVLIYTRTYKEHRARANLYGTRRVNAEPPLLIIGKFPEDLELARLKWPEEARENIGFNSAKFSELELSEVIFDGMPFLLTRLSESETGSRFAADRFDSLFCDLPSSKHSAIGVRPGNHLAGAAKLPEVNRRLLQLGRWIGRGLDADFAAWSPSRRLASFSFYDEIVTRYVDDGPLPILLQASFLKVGDRHFVTRGVDYFAGQEIRLVTPPDYSDAEAARHLVRVILDVATHGRINGFARSAGLVPGEILEFSPGEDNIEVEIVTGDDGAGQIAGISGN